MERLYLFQFVIHLQLLLLILSAATMDIAVDAADEEDPSSSSAIISRFQQFLRINTSQPDPQYHKAAEFLVSQAISIGLEYKILEFVKDKPVVLLAWPGSDLTLPSILLNSHVDVVPAEEDKWLYPPFEAHIDADGNIFARGTQDMKSVGMQYLEAIRRLKSSGAFRPQRTIYISFVPDEEIGGEDGTKLFVASDQFAAMNVGVVLDEGGPTPIDVYVASYAERSGWWLSIKATGEPGHGSKLYDNTAMENLLKSLDSVWRFRASQFDLIKSGLKAPGEVVSANLVFLKAGTPSPTGFVMNSQPSEAEAGFDIRVPPTADPDALERRIAEEWAPASRNMTYKFQEKTPVRDEFGRPILTKTEGNPWWNLFKEAIESSNATLLPPQIVYGSTDARYYRQRGVSAFGFSPMPNTPMLLHAHNEFLNQHVYLKGIDIYMSIIEAYASDVDEHSNEEAAAACHPAISNRCFSAFPVVSCCLKQNT